jgi:hypothetical protein
MDGTQLTRGVLDTTNSSPPASARRSRRSVLTAAAAAGGALATQALVRPTPVAAADVALGAVNTAPTATTIRSTEASGSARALIGQVLTTGSGFATAGVFGQSYADGGNGVLGIAPTGASKGVFGRSTNGIGVYGETTATTGATTGVRGYTPSGSGTGVHGAAAATSGGTNGVLGTAASPGGRGVQGSNTATNGTGVYGVANNGVTAKGVWGRTVNGGQNHARAGGVYGEATGSGTGVSAYNASGGYGVEATGSIAIRGYTTGSGFIGVAGESATYGVVGYGAYGTIGNGTTVGVHGYAQSPTATAVAAEGGTTGVRAITSTNYGVEAKAKYGVRAEGSATDGIGVDALGLTAIQATGGTQGVVATGANFGLSGTGSTGVLGFGDDIGVYGQGGSFAGDFAGNVRVSDVLEVNGSKAFVIDHPSDPANKTLAHSCVEAPEVMNIYRGAATLDDRGRATVRMPGYFRAINTDFGYQLTPVGAAAPELHVAREIERNSFAIAGGTPGLKVCWVVTAVRSDAWAKAHPFRVERRKRRKDHGTYLHPELYGRPQSEAVNRAAKPQKAGKPPRLARVPELPRVMRGKKAPSPRSARRARAS